MRKGVFVWLRFAVILLLLFVLAEGVALAQDETAERPTISVTGTARVSLPPDTAYVTLGVVTEGKDVLAAQAANSSKAQAIYNTLLAQGVKKEDIKTVTYSIQPVHDFEKKPPVITAYRVENLMEVRLRPLDKVGRILAAIGTEGANMIYGLRFAAELNQDAARSHALEQASVNALRQAETVAKALGATLGSIQTVSVQLGNSEPPQPIRFSETKAVDASLPQVPISPGQVEVWASVSIVFCLD